MGDRFLTRKMAVKLRETIFPVLPDTPAIRRLYIIPHVPYAALIGRDHAGGV